VNATNLTGDALVEAHKSATRKLRLVSVLLPVVFMSVIFAYLASIADQIKHIDSAAVGAKLSDRVNALMPDIQSSLTEIADAVQPKLYEALETEGLAMAPQIEHRLQSDVESTTKNAKNDMEVATKTAMAKQTDAQRALLVKEFPQLASDTAAQDKVLAAMTSGLVQWETRQLDATVAEHLNAMEQLHKTLQQSYSKKTNEEADPEDALMTWLNLMNEHVGGNQKILGTEKNSKGASAAAAQK
jgi:hypothetical protein